MKKAFTIIEIIVVVVVVGILSLAAISKINTFIDKRNLNNAAEFMINSIYKAAIDIMSVQYDYPDIVFARTNSFSSKAYSIFPEIYFHCVANDKTHTCNDKEYGFSIFVDTPTSKRKMNSMPDKGEYLADIIDGKLLGVPHAGISYKNENFKPEHNLTKTFGIKRNVEIIENTGIKAKTGRIKIDNKGMFYLCKNKSCTKSAIKAFFVRLTTVPSGENLTKDNCLCMFFTSSMHMSILPSGDKGQLAIDGKKPKYCHEL